MDVPGLTLSRANFDTQRRWPTATGRRRWGFASVVQSMNIEFLKPARMDDRLAILAAPEETEGDAMTPWQKVLCGEEVLAATAGSPSCRAAGRGRSPSPRAPR
jgi:acyl-CoA thioesterase FadM